VANDAYIAGVAALLGVGLSGGVQTWIAVRKDQRDRRRSVRLLAEEMETFAVAMRYAELRPDSREAVLRTLGPPVVHRAEQGTLARELNERHWLLVSNAYVRYTTVQALCARDEDHADLPGASSILPTTRMVLETVKSLERASGRLAPRYQRPRIWLFRWRRARSAEGRRLRALRTTAEKAASPRS
jgi:hypothetical protein